MDNYRLIYFNPKFKNIHIKDEWWIFHQMFFEEKLAQLKNSTLYQIFRSLRIKMAYKWNSFSLNICTSNLNAQFSIRSLLYLRIWKIIMSLAFLYISIDFCSNTLALISFWSLNALYKTRILSFIALSAYRFFLCIQNWFSPMHDESFNRFLLSPIFHTIIINWMHWLKAYKLRNW